MSDTALVLFSGGQDSATCLAWALDRFQHVETIAFDYGQNHRVELAVRGAFLAALRAAYPAWATKLGGDHVIDMGLLATISDTALTHDRAIEMTEAGLPNTFVPGRNLMFFTTAAAVAYRRGARHLVGGMCETDYSGYPDCRDDTLKALQVALTLGLDRRTTVHTPLMWLDKAATWAMAQRLGGAALVEMIVEHTHTCYRGVRDRRHDWGYGCDDCPACELRKGDGNALSPTGRRAVTYSVKEVFYTLQGEGANAGRPAVFCRFAGCNLWSGREADRAQAMCQFCDTDFVGTDGPGGGKFANAAALAAHVDEFWPAAPGGRKLVVCTGGEPALQIDAALVDALHGHGFEIAIETNGTLALPAGIDWICVSPRPATR